MDRKLGGLIAVLLPLATAFAAPGESITFMGAELGAPMRFEKCPLLGQVERPCWRPLDLTGHRPPASMANDVQLVVPKDKMPHGVETVYLTVLDGRVERVTAHTTGILSQDSVLSALTAKFGPPSKLSRIPVKTLSGGQFESIKAIWALPSGTSAVFAGTAGSVDFGIATVMTQAAAKHLKESSRTQPGF